MTVLLSVFIGGCTFYCSVSGVPSGKEAALVYMFKAAGFSVFLSMAFAFCTLKAYSLRQRVTKLENLLQEDVESEQRSEKDSKDDYQEDTRRVLDDYFGGSIFAFVNAFKDRQDFSEEDRDELRRFLKEL
jgi:hypothetical protein